MLARKTLGAARFLIPTLLLGLASCGDSNDPPLDFNGTYMLTVINGPNGCMVNNYTEGQTGMVDVTVTQNMTDPTMLTVKIANPLVALIYNLFLGTDTFIGTASGNTLTATAQGNTAMVPMTMCQATPIITINGTLTNNTLAGTIGWTFTTNGHGECAHRNGCQNKQSFSGVRPPPI